MIPFTCVYFLQVVIFTDEILYLFTFSFCYLISYIYYYIHVICLQGHSLKESNLMPAEGHVLCDRERDRQADREPSSGGMKNLRFCGSEL